MTPVKELEPSAEPSLTRAEPSLPDAFRSVRLTHTGTFWRRAIGFAGPGLPGRRRLHGPGQLGHRPRRRRALRLRAALGPPDLQPDGDPAAEPLRALGIVTGRDLAQACRDTYCRPVSRRALAPLRDRHRRLRPGRGARLRHRAQAALRHPALSACCITGARRAAHPACCSTAASARWKRFIIALVGTIGVCFVIEIFSRAPTGRRVVARLRPVAPRSSRNPDDALHRDRHPRRDGDAAQPLPALRPSCRRATSRAPPEASARPSASLPSTRRVALMLALFVNAAILILAAAVFHRSGHNEVAEIEDAHKLLDPAARRRRRQRAVRRGPARLRPELHAHRHARRADRDGRLPQHPPAALAAPPDHPRSSPSSRPSSSRSSTASSGTADLLILSQVILSMQLSFAVVPAGAVHQRPPQDGRVHQPRTLKYVGYAVACSSPHSTPGSSSNHCITLRQTRVAGASPDGWQLSVELNAGVKSSHGDGCTCCCGLLHFLGAALS